MTVDEVNILKSQCEDQIDAILANLQEQSGCVVSKVILTTAIESERFIFMDTPPPSVIIKLDFYTYKR